MDGPARAALLFQEAYEAQMRGDLRDAVRLYEQSLTAHPTAEAHTFLGWTWSFLGDLDRAIACCKRAIEVDPSFGNPYNDIGAYLIERGQLDEAVPWLERAKRATRYDAPQFPRFNLGRLYLARDMLTAALREFEEALCVQPGYEPAIRAIAAVKRKLN
ncbi:MAG TPA: tetratricopeptide repeat protein [Vicinamibacteria bacterium]|nr:tetratricopeptide repeat protein [Vicinamibacteria bacterium]